ncbi:MAG: isoprenoid biosynthesis glyoxalase ElbB [Desulfobacterales bacterium]|nr:isoprenoid biosynthesis glyoxalase ElbB [Desulfobacterales bacterium]
MKKIGVLLAGCGKNDGSEIHESVLTLLSIDRANAKAVCMAPDMDQLHVINHLTGMETEEKRNVLVESARIARGEITDIKNITAEDIDALVIPGGAGSIKNLSNYAIKGTGASVNHEVLRLINEMSDKAKPIGAICIAPATLTKALSSKNPEVTVGNDISSAEKIEAMGGRHKICTVDNIHIDKNNRLVSTPAYMLGPGIKDISIGIEKLINQIIDMI